MKKFSMLLVTFVLTATCAQSQTQPGQTSSGTTGVQPDTRQLLPNQTPSQPGVINGQTTGRVIPNTPNPVPFGGTNQVTFGTTNPPFASTNQGFASTNTPRL